VTLPASIKVGPFRYRVVCDWQEFANLGSGPDLWGECHHKVETIYLNPRLAGTALAETLWHEVKHVVYRAAGIEDDKEMTEEQAVNTASPMELAVLRENPELVRFLLDDGAA
jgi:hypothetical protein